MCVQPFNGTQFCTRVEGVFLCTFCTQRLSAMQEEEQILQENVEAGAEIVLSDAENDVKVLQNEYERCSITFFWHTKV